MLQIATAFGQGDSLKEAIENAYSMLPSRNITVLSTTQSTIVNSPYQHSSYWIKNYYFTLTYSHE
jgi:hypothetical protein